MKSYNAADYLDKATILAACDQIDDYAKDYFDMGDAVAKAGAQFSADVLSIEGESLDGVIIEKASMISDYRDQIQSLTNDIRARVNEEYDRLQETLNWEKQQAEAEAAQASNNN